MISFYLYIKCYFINYNIKFRPTNVCIYIYIDHFARCKHWSRNTFLFQFVTVFFISHVKKTY